jgi:hypothetical protein
LCPPNPKELDIAVDNSFFMALFGVYFKSHSSSGLSLLNTHTLKNEVKLG